MHGGLDVRAPSCRRQARRRAPERAGGSGRIPVRVSEEGEVFDVARLEGSRFTHPRIAALVRFERAGRRINVRGEDVDVDFTAVLTLDPAGQCRFVVGEALYAEWEIRRMALELLFFDEPEAPE
jgi:hypothetical protein